MTSNTKSTERRIPLALLTFLLFSIPAVLASAITTLPTGGASLLPADPLNQPGNFWEGSFNGQPVASAQVVDVDHPDFSQAMRVTVTNPAGQFYNGAVQLRSNPAVAESDVILIRLFFRSIESKDESGVGFATVFPQGPAPDYNKYVQQEVTATNQWVEYFFPFQITESLAAGDLSLQIGAGAGSKTQTWEIAAIDFINYRNTRTVDELPKTRPTYAGRDPDAPWRAAAAARIEQHRKGDFRIRVLDTQGSPVPDATISVEFLRHAYHFGSVIVASRIFGNEADDITYREKFLDLFNQSGPENDFKWAPWAGEWGNAFNATQTLAAMQWLQDRDIYTRGHVMVWPSKRNLPNLIQSYLPEGNPAAADPAAKQVVLDHIDDVASRSAPVIDEWDVLNEPYDNHYLMDAFGNQVMLDWFARARTHLPRQDLYLNDYSILSGGGRDFAHQQHFEDTIEYLVSNDAPITGIGMQGHFSSSPTGIELVYSILNRYHNHFPHLKIRVTEFDIVTDDEEMQADYTRDFLTIMFSHPATVGVQNWGFWENAHWRSSAAMYTADWREKPNAVAWRRLTQETWWNDFAGDTNTSGEYANRGFYGDYHVTITHTNETTEFTLPLHKGGPNEFEITLGSTSTTDTPTLRIQNTPTTPTIFLSEIPDQAYFLNTSRNLRDWSTLVKFKQTTPGLRYRFPLNTAETNFLRLEAQP
ncbi:Glycosyl hydrolase family 10 protein [Verrucomicrobiia bacterium DG1235]|nr:Glycosyl hydrolase family 10 protein [Verrucomicrobiae bacterium DG1235]